MQLKWTLINAIRLFILSYLLTVSTVNKYTHQSPFCCLTPRLRHNNNPHNSQSLLIGCPRFDWISLSKQQTSLEDRDMTGPCPTVPSWSFCTKVKPTCYDLLYNENSWRHGSYYPTSTYINSNWKLRRTDAILHFPGPGFFWIDFPILDKKQRNGAGAKCWLQWRGCIPFPEGQHRASGRSMFFTATQKSQKKALFFPHSPYSKQFSLIEGAGRALLARMSNCVRRFRFEDNNDSETSLLLHMR